MVRHTQTTQKAPWGNKMKNHFQFSLKEIFLPNIMFRLNPSFKPKSGKIEITTSVEVDYSCTGTDLTVQVRVEMPDGEHAPFAFMVEGIGRFELVEEPPADLLEIIARANGAAMIFPYLREAVADLTRRAGVPTLHLQPVNFVELMNMEKAKKKEAALTKKPVSKKVRVSK